MVCLEPKMTRGKVEGEDDWFCLLCNAHAELVHYACEFLNMFVCSLR